MAGPSGLPAVVIAVRGLQRGGAERLVFEEARGLEERGFNVEVWYQVTGEFVRALDDLGMVVRRVPASAARAELRRARLAYGRFTVHTHSPSFGAMLRSAAVGLGPIRFVHTEHNLVESYRRPTRLAHRLMACKIDALVAVSGPVLAASPRCRDRRVVHHIDLTTERMQDCLRQEFRQTGELTVACVASLTIKKDHENLMRALDVLASDGSIAVQVLLIGDGPLRSELTERARQLNARGTGVKVNLLGERDDIPSLLGGSDVVVLPSRAEGLPLIVLEAMAASTPVVATAVGGVQELVEDGETGVLVPPGDPARLAEALERLLGNRELRRELAVEARTSLDGLAPTSWIDQYVDILAP